MVSIILKVSPIALAHSRKPGHSVILNFPWNIIYLFEGKLVCVVDSESRNTPSRRYAAGDFLCCMISAIFWERSSAVKGF
ncbi:hypothetical protein SAMN02745216_00378 [Desulfatibacillum alkenivorans DSM 16219]|uniref:Uncharacterized protein n=1 Tax=Desulfatibacillum alkenivorans DSM 16219 TaxID=1121393 RepID=A0A1M6D0W3_9BACT|nr:hypothetical protein SAMN02745216_00378 [Desulfatibacillum alkenivorans DSM 16219]